VLLLWGANDQIVPLATAKALQKNYSDFYGKEMELFVYPKTGHALALERPRKFVKFIKENATVKTYRSVGTPSF
jgi:pimeloyl-ACP methyl ester carboxylesterase